MKGIETSGPGLGGVVGSAAERGADMAPLPDGEQVTSLEEPGGIGTEGVDGLDAERGSVEDVAEDPLLIGNRFRGAFEELPREIELPEGEIDDSLERFNQFMGEHRHDIRAMDLGGQSVEAFLANSAWAQEALRSNELGMWDIDHGKIYKEMVLASARGENPTPLPEGIDHSHELLNLIGDKKVEPAFIDDIVGKLPEDLKFDDAAVSEALARRGPEGVARLLPRLEKGALDDGTFTKLREAGFDNQLIDQSIDSLSETQVDTLFKAMPLSTQYDILKRMGGEQSPEELISARLGEQLEEGRTAPEEELKNIFNADATAKFPFAAAEILFRRGSGEFVIDHLDRFKLNAEDMERLSNLSLELGLDDERKKLHSSPMFLVIAQAGGEPAKNREQPKKESGVKETAKRIARWVGKMVGEALAFMVEKVAEMANAMKEAVRK